MYSKRSSAVLVGVGVSLGLALTAAPAAARWRIHDEAAATQLLAPPGGTEGQACQERVRAEAGWVASEDPTFVPPSDSTAYDAVRYQVWQAPAGFSTFSGATSVVDASGEVIDYIFTDASGGEHHATRVADVVSPPRHLLSPPEPTDGSALVFTKAAFFADLGASVRVGDLLGLRPVFSSSEELEDLTVVDCAFSAQGGTYRARAGRRTSLTVGHITGPGGPDDYSVRIGWGDRSGQSTGEVRRSAGGDLLVAGTHRYARRGVYGVRVTVRQLYTGTTHVYTAQVRVRR
jgi:hypothetical protein